MVAWRYVTPGYFAAMGIPMRRGRPFTQLDRGVETYSVVLSETAARLMFPARGSARQTHPARTPGPVVHRGGGGR